MVRRRATPTRRRVKAMPAAAWYDPWPPPIFAAPQPQLPLPPLPPVFPWGDRPLIFAPAADASQPATSRPTGPPPLPLAPGLLNSLLTALPLSGQQSGPRVPANGPAQSDGSQSAFAPQVTTDRASATGAAAGVPAGIRWDVTDRACRIGPVRLPAINLPANRKARHRRRQLTASVAMGPISIPRASIGSIGLASIESIPSCRRAPTPIRSAS